MDRRQQKTRSAILNAFSDLLASHRSYSRITVQEIIDEANVGRTTFYAHFETKDDLLGELCRELFDHIILTALNAGHTHGLYSEGNVPESVFCHLLYHLRENDYNVLELLSGEDSDLFMRYFKNSLNELVKLQFSKEGKPALKEISDDFLVNHISGSFVEMVRWWIRNGLKESPECMDKWFRVVLAPLF